ncbi:MAG: hypothetical protein OEU92_12730 [Alphaproteobacteria bacterium]|nr:hypothetical protein [Alphaproteobacteria bacterium]
MTTRPLSDDERETLWKLASRRLTFVDIEPPVRADTVDQLLKQLGPRGGGQPIGDWLKGAAEQSTVDQSQTAEVIRFDPKRQRFNQIAEFTRLAADSISDRVPLPAAPLETSDGRFRLDIQEAADQMIRVLVQALGDASDELAGRLIGLAAEGNYETLIGLVELDEDGDGTIRLHDDEATRKALLRPVLGTIDDV